MPLMDPKRPSHFGKRRGPALGAAEQAPAPAPKAKSPEKEAKSEKKLPKRR